MKKMICYVLVMITIQPAFSQSAPELISRVQQAQQQLRDVSYNLQRRDTFVTGQTRDISGQAKMHVLPSDAVFGFAFWGKRDGIDIETIYDGQKTLDIFHDKKEFRLNKNPNAFPHILGSPGGQMILPDLVKLDTANATGFDISEDKDYYYLTIHLPDITEYDVTKRTRWLRIDKKIMLPVQWRSYQETLGKVQHLDYLVQDLRINDAALVFDFAAWQMPDDYMPETYGENKVHKSLMNNTAPVFTLAGFDGKAVASEKFRGKTVLLDFWEVWCGPCVASMPKVQALFEKYKSKGLLVYGITNETDQLDAARLLVKKKQIAFPMLAGNKQLEKDYSVLAVPMYVLIDKTGTIRFISEGFSDKLEEEIKKLL